MDVKICTNSDHRLYLARENVTVRNGLAIVFGMKQYYILFKWTAQVLLSSCVDFIGVYCQVNSISYLLMTRGFQAITNGKTNITPGWTYGRHFKYQRRIIVRE